MTDSDRRRGPNEAPRPHRNDTPEDEYALYAHEENQKPEGPPRRRTRREDLESHEETRGILEDRQTMADLAAAEAAVEAGDTVDADTLRAMIASRAKPHGDRQRRPNHRA
jgi:hypothetical protein